MSGWFPLVRDNNWDKALIKELLVNGSWDGSSNRHRRFQMEISNCDIGVPYDGKQLRVTGGICVTMEFQVDGVCGWVVPYNVYALADNIDDCLSIIKQEYANMYWGYVRKDGRNYVPDAIKELVEEVSLNSLGSVLKLKRQALNLTIEAITGILDDEFDYYITHNEYKLIEGNQKKPSAMLIAHICDMLKLNLYDTTNLMYETYKHEIPPANRYDKYVPRLYMSPIFS